MRGMRASGRCEYMTRVATYLFCAIIVATLAGGIGGSLQPARVMLATLAPFVLILSPVRTMSPIARHAMSMAMIMILFGVVSLSWSEDVIGGLGILLAVTVGGLALYIVTRIDLSLNGVRLLIWAWVAAVGISMPVAFYEITTGNHFQFAFDDRTIGGIGTFPFASIFFGNYNDFSAWLCLSYTITMAAFFEAKKVSSRLLITLINISLALVIFVNTSRASLFYIFIVLIFFIYRSKEFRIYASIFLMAIIFALLATYQEEVLGLYNLAVYRFETTNALDESYIQRAGLVEASVRGIIESYGAGIGAGGFEEYINDNYPYFIPNPHNILTEIGVNFGIVPLILFVLFFIRLFLIGLFRRDIPDSFRVALMLSAIAVPIIGAVASQAIGYIYWWVWIATLVAIASVRMPEGNGGAFPKTDAQQGIHLNGLRP